MKTSWVEPLAVLNAQGETCRNCRDNRQAEAYVRKGKKRVVFGLVKQGEHDKELNVRNGECCKHDYKDGELVYGCPIFKDLISAYKQDIYVQGTNVNPCKHCPLHMDNGGSCLGDKCPDGPFEITRAGVIRC